MAWWWEALGQNSYKACSLYVYDIRADKQYKTFQVGDVLANLSGGTLGIFLASRLEQVYRDHRSALPVYMPVDLATMQHV